jgi:hypothetical protein
MIVDNRCPCCNKPVTGWASSLKRLPVDPEETVLCQHCETPVFLVPREDDLELADYHFEEE